MTTSLISSRNGSQSSSGMSEIAALARRVVRVVRESVAISYPHWLLRQLMGRRQIIGVKLLGRDVKIRFQGSRFLPGRSGILLVPLIKNIAGAYGGKRDARRQQQLDLLFSFGTHGRTLAELVN